MNAPRGRTARALDRIRRLAALALLVGLGSLARTPLPAQGYVVIHDFAIEDGANPRSPLVQGPDGFFYGTAALGEQALGTLFRTDSGDNFTVLHVFDCQTGCYPEGPLLLAADGALYGVTSMGGTDDNGVIYRIETNGQDYAVVHDFDYEQLDMSQGYSGLVQDPDGRLFGAATGIGQGVVFGIDPSGSNYAVLHEFGTGVDDGFDPAGHLLLGSDLRLYGTTSAGHMGVGQGTVFRVDRSGAAFETIHEFQFEDPLGGLFPLDTVIEGTDGVLYGTTATGGQYSKGTAFRMEKDGSGFQVIHDFDDDDGIYPETSLTQIAGGLLCGVVPAGGGSDGGTLFRLTTSGELFGVVHDFEPSTGEKPHAPPVQSLDGALYGAASGGGEEEWGTLYRATIPAVASLTPSSGAASGGTALVLSGGPFQDGATVFIGGTFVGAVVEPSQIQTSSPPLPAGTLADVLVMNPNSSIALREDGWLADFVDVPRADAFHDFVETIVRRAITVGCGGGAYCRDDPVTRAQMAVFLLKAEHGRGYVPPACSDVFSDVVCPSTFADWIEQLAAEGITGGCGGGNYCPGAAVTRAQMSVFLLKTEHGSAYAPPACTGIFGDVTCPSNFAAWIERLAAENVTGGCGGGNYCPNGLLTRGQMAVFLAKALGLQWP